MKRLVGKKCGVRLSVLTETPKCGIYSTHVVTHSERVRVRNTDYAFRICAAGAGGISFLSCLTIGPTHNTPSVSSQWDVSVCMLRGFPEPLKGGFAASQRGYFRSMLFEITHSCLSEACAEVLVEPKLFWSHLVSK